MVSSFSLMICVARSFSWQERIIGMELARAEYIATISMPTMTTEKSTSMRVKAEKRLILGQLGFGLPLIPEVLIPRVPMNAFDKVIDKCVSGWVRAAV